VRIARQGVQFWRFHFQNPTKKLTLFRVLSVTKTIFIRVTVLFLLLLRNSSSGLLSAAAPCIHLCEHTSPLRRRSNSIVCLSPNDFRLVTCTHSNNTPYNVLSDRATLFLRSRPLSTLRSEQFGLPDPQHNRIAFQQQHAHILTPVFYYAAADIVFI